MADDTVWVVEQCEHCHPSGHEFTCCVAAVCDTEDTANAYRAAHEPDLKQRCPDGCLRIEEWPLTEGQAA